LPHVGAGSHQNWLDNGAAPDLLGGANWLGTDITAGVLTPGQTVQLHVNVHSQSLLPGSYMGTLTFTSSRQAYDSPQVVNVALTIQPHCGLMTSSGILNFTAVVGQSNPSSQVLGLSATPSCAGVPLSWQVTSLVSWITVTPTSGQIKGTASSVTSVGVNT